MIIHKPRVFNYLICKAKVFQELQHYEAYSYHVKESFELLPADGNSRDGKTERVEINNRLLCSVKPLKNQLNIRTG